MGFFDDPANQPTSAAPSTASSYAPKNGNLEHYLNGGTLLDPWTKEFTAPSEQDALNSPGLQFAINEAFRVGQAGAAAKGDLLNGRVQAGLQTNAIGQALQGYGDVYNRSLGQYLLSRENFQQNQDRPYAKLTGFAQLGKPQVAP